MNSQIKEQMGYAEKLIKKEKRFDWLLKPLRSVLNREKWEIPGILGIGIMAISFIFVIYQAIMFYALGVIPSNSSQMSYYQGKLLWGFGGTILGYIGITITWIISKN